MSFFTSALSRALQKRRVQIYIDGLQECRETEEDTQELIKKFQDIIKKLEKSHNNASLCFSSRFYPVHAPKDTQNCVKIETENKGDVER